MADVTFRNVDTSEIPEELAKALQPMIVKWETAALKVAAAHDPQRPQTWKRGSVEELLSLRFNQLPDISKTRAESRSDAVLTSARFPRRAERLLGLDVKDVDHTPMVAPAPKLTRGELNRLKAFTASLALAAAEAAPAAEPAAGAAAPTTWDRLSLQFIRVACIDETNGWFGTERGSDEISIGGAVLDTDGNTNKVPPVDLGGSWDDGDVRDLSPPKPITAYSLRGGLTFPHALFLTLVLVERDGSGMQDIINGLVDKIAEEAKTTLTALLAAAAGGGVGGPIGVLVGLAVAYAIDKIVHKIRHLWDDVAFVPRTIWADIPSRQATFAGNRTSPSSVVRFLGDGDGEYACRYQWQLSEVN